MRVEFVFCCLFAAGIAVADDLETEFGGHTKLRVVSQGYPADSIYHDLVGNRATDVSASLRLKFGARAGRWSFDSAYQLAGLRADSLAFEALPNDDTRFFSLRFGQQPAETAQRPNAIVVCLSSDHARHPPAAVRVVTSQPDFARPGGRIESHEVVAVLLIRPFVAGRSRNLYVPVGEFGDPFVVFMPVQVKLKHPLDRFPHGALFVLSEPVERMVHEGQTDRAVQLLGLASARPTQTPTWMENWPLLREIRQEIEDDMGSQNYAELWERGRTLDLQETVKALLEVSGE